MPLGPSIITQLGIRDGLTWPIFTQGLHKIQQISPLLNPFIIIVMQRLETAAGPSLYSIHRASLGGWIAAPFHSIVFEGTLHAAEVYVYWTGS